ncbi:MAG: ankyrin repeat domain-containing protein [Candidatus Endonucleobacter bathymodioli]|uniref:Ankyrin repeat domain-containing protein n=1 Tax=Candidatus Endonucleibacter bathymodioli TaxID=539814 RepID=A0AA90SCH7_9GAMM|nr:ankyrin repeat domain-containing protein [Candidatus Endonucleobacter bathymodioli]
MFLALHKNMARPYHSIYLLLFFSIITGVYSSGYCAVEAVDPNSYETAPLIDSVDESSNTLLDSAAGHNSNTYKDGSFLDIVQKMDDCALLDAMECLLDIAITNNDVKLMNILQLSKAPHHLNTGNDATALQCADLNHNYVTNFFRDNIVSHTSTYESGEGLLSAVIPIGNNKLIDLLVEAGVNVNSYDKNNNTPLHQAVRCGHLDIVKLLLAADAEVNCVSSRTYIDVGSGFCSCNIITPLQMAVLKRNLGIVKVLLDSKANPNYCEEGQYTSLRMAIQVNSDTIVDTLLKAGANVNELSNFDSLLNFAVLRSSKPEIINALISNGAKYKKCSRDDLQLYRTIFNGDSKSLKLLIQDGFDPNYSYMGERPLHMTARDITSHVDSMPYIFEILIAAGANINYKNASGLTPLMIIVQHQYLNSAHNSIMKLIIRMLLSNGADIDSMDDKKGNTALHYAAKNGNDDFVSLLLENGAMRDIENFAGLKAEECAAPRISKTISEASFVTREPARLGIIARSSIRNLIIKQHQTKWERSFSEMINDLKVPKLLYYFLNNHI